MDETTLPSPDEGSLRSQGAAPCWFLVLAFHPDPRRIGECWRAPVSQCLRINRSEPLLGPAPGDDGPPRSLEDPHVGRDLLSISAVPGGWQLQRRPGRCRVRVDGQELQDSLLLAPGRMRDGLVLLIAHRVVLHLRLASAADVQELAEAPPGTAELLGVSPAACRLRRSLAQAARGTGDVLLLGPTGTGKEVAARTIHSLSSPAAPWVAVNMSVLGPELAAAELFGARRGAYTGAQRDRPGYFQRAAGGTLFLDEIGDTPPSVQAQLLRALQEREVQVLGGAVERVDLRVLAATEVDPSRGGSGFRAALRYRLGACEIRLPEISRRREDIAVIAAHSLRHAVGAGLLAGPAPSLDDLELARWAGCFEELLLRDWPGNIRELLNCLQELIALSGDRLQLPAGLPGARAPLEQAAQWSGRGGAATQAALVREPSQPGIEALSDAQFQQLWSEEGGEITAMARRLGVSRQAIYRRRRGVPGCRLAREIPEAELRSVLQRCAGDAAAAARELNVSLAGLQSLLGEGGARLAGDGGAGQQEDA